MAAALASIPFQSAAQARPVLIAFLTGTSNDAGMQRGAVEPLRRGLRELGYVEGRNLRIEFRWAEGAPERLSGLLTELIALGPDVIVTSGPRAALLARGATRTIPIVAVAVDDPVQMGLATSHARPGGNITGLSGGFSGVLSRRTQLLKDLVPAARRFALLMNPQSVPAAEVARGVAEIEARLGFPVLLLQASSPADFDAAFATMVRERVDGVVILADATFYTHRMQLGALCLRHRLVSVWGGRDYLEGGGVASYQGDFAALFHRAASLVDKILKGTPPGEIPFEQSTKLELVVNLKGARALGLRVPASVLVAADAVLE